MKRNKPRYDYKNLSRDVVTIMGQTSIRRSLSPFQSRNKPFIIVATPGRFRDMLNNEASFRESFRYLKNIVIDEADELLNQNFKDELIEIISTLKSLRERLPEEEGLEEGPSPKTMMFSATIDDNVKELAHTAFGGKDMPFIDITHDKVQVNENITQSLIRTDSLFHNYSASLKYIMDQVLEARNDKHPFKAMVFISNTNGVELYSSLLSALARQHHFRNVWKLHGKLTQGERNMAQGSFRTASKGVLVASNVAARGLDFPGVTHVIQIGVNSEIAGHTHRVGRTGRAGKKGDSVLFISHIENGYVKALEKDGNEFHSVEDHAVDEEFDDSLKRITANLDIDNIVTASISAMDNVPGSVCDIPKMTLLRENSKLYQDLSDDYDTLPFLSKKQAIRMRCDTEGAREYFSIPGAATTVEKRNRGGRYGSGNNNRGHQFDRRGGSGYNNNYNRSNRNYKGDNSSRGGYNNRRNYNDREGHGGYKNKRGYNDREGRGGRFSKDDADW
ncbi:unnamed protein product [Ambrosiozyma monospora]|uniref:ATP-dependent RNA helicase n=1 Tax=Ambrosiozyma monospora TaxID=43982 RepID=A0A9W7DEP4_AMBMO|nr:unnamed protein product [Ambrosiozyma monospora]